MYARFGSLYLALYLAQRPDLPADEAEQCSAQKEADLRAVQTAGWLALGVVVLAVSATWWLF